MTMTCHVLHAGDGYTYLTRQVAAGDVERSAHEELADYYLAAGNPPGEWVGSGITALGMRGQVSEEHMLALFGEGLHPDADRLIQTYIAAGMPFAKAVDRTRLGRRFYTFDEPDIPLVAAARNGYDQFEREHQRRPSVAERRVIKERVAGELLAGPGGTPPAPEVVRRFLADELGKARQPVAGVDLVFSPVKSVSVLWALGGPQVRQVVEQVHEAAWRQALAYGEREAGYTRVGKNGVAQIDTHGFVATAFVHRDSRAGDPDLHTHVAVANRVLGVDGRWRTLDSKQLHRVAVSMSEVYNAAVEHGLTERLGVDWVEVAKAGGKRAVREIDGVPVELIRGFSRRRTQVEAGYDALVADYVARYGHTPPRSVQIQLAQQATLADRPDKQAGRTLHQQVTAWTADAARMLPGQNVDAVLAAALGRATMAAEPLDVAALAAQVIDVVSAHRATWTIYHVRAETIRALKPHGFATAAAREQAVEQVVAAALGTESLELGIAPAPPPALLARADGESIYHRHGSTRYTSTAILDAETRLLDAAARTAGPVVPPLVARAAIARHEHDAGRALDAGQRQLVEHFVSGGRALAVGIGPPGTGKSTAMRAVRAAWETTGGRVIGLAPSAAAASVLGDELGIPADTLHSLAAAHGRGDEVDVRAGDMLLVDEAGMAGTLLLDRIRAIAAERGAVVRLVGDYRQLAAVEAGGALRLIHHEHGGTELARVHRFRDPAEAAAVLALRVGDPTCLDFYTGRGRLHGGTRAAVLDQLYGDWRTDTAAGRTAIMISDSTEITRELSARAQTERRATGRAEAGGVQLHDGATAGMGDRVVTRRNARRLAVLGGADYVKNGDLWDVTARHDDGALTVRHARHHGKVMLPASYVAEHVELGYAATIHRSQGLTVDISRAYLTPLAVREAALVALSRGTDANHAYLDTETVLATDEPETLPGDLFYRHREQAPVAAAFTTILRREGAESSATEALRAGLDEPYRLDTVVPRYEHALALHRGPDAMAAAADWVRQALPARHDDIVADSAWPALAATLLQIRDTGADPALLLARRAAQRPLEDDPADPARSAAQVLHHRLAADLPTASPVADPAVGAGQPELLPAWVAAPPGERPGQDPAVAELGGWLREQADAIAARVRDLGERAAEQTPVWTAHLGPLPPDPIERERWIAVAGQVAAYRERFAIPDEDPALLPSGRSGEADRARAWVERHLTATATAVPADLDTRHEVREEVHERGQLLREYNRLAIEALLAQAEGDHIREQHARAALEQFTARHPEVVDTDQRDNIRALRADAPSAIEGFAAWESRPFATLTDRQLVTEITQQYQQAADAAQRQADTAARLAALAPQVQAGHGPRVQAVDARLAELSERAVLAAEHARVAREQQAARAERDMATAQAIGKDWEASRLTHWDSIRRPGRRDALAASATGLRAAAARAETTAAELGVRMRELAQQASEPGQLHRAEQEARRAHDQHDRDRHAARTADQHDLDQLRHQIDRHGAAAAKASAACAELGEEQQLRADMPDDQRQRESGYRTTWNTEQTAHKIQQRQAERRRALEYERYEPHDSQHLDRGPHLGL
ncbi:MobF family relaxase [Amycolatopsis sp. NPDC051903]|uniref:MobF family relaxase n=1 Tax=Amycolatopsis sp. NPDC051903 TaxID=3363936 RepID=UPI00378CDDF3